MALSQKEVSLHGGGWHDTRALNRATWVCGFCGDKVGSDKGYWAGPNEDGSGAMVAFIRICPTCDGPTLFTRSGKHFPGSAPGQPVSHVPEKLSQLYNEARSSAAATAYTAAVLACRKMLMNIAVEEGAKAGRSFVEYVGYLAKQGYVPPNGKVWVDYIRKRGNEANHEIELMEEQDAIALITLVGMLLRFIYEFPMLVPAEVASTESADSPAESPT